MTYSWKKMILGFGCAICLWSLAGARSSKTYEIQPQIPESFLKSDTEKALEAYERLLNHALALNGQQINSLNMNVSEVSKHVSEVEAKIDYLIQRTILVQKALGIPDSEILITGTSEAEDPNNQRNAEE